MQEQVSTRDRTPPDLNNLAQRVVAAAERCRFTLVTAESCTAGRIAALLSDVPGAGKFFHGGFVVYTKKMKTSVLGVSSVLLQQQTAVSAAVAKAMATGALQYSPADVALAVTGVLGPDPDEDGNPVGLVYCATARRGQAPRAVKLTHQEGYSILQSTLVEALHLLHDECLVGR